MRRRGTSGWSGSERRIRSGIGARVMELRYDRRVMHVSSIATCGRRCLVEARSSRATCVQETGEQSEKITTSSVRAWRNSPWACRKVLFGVGPVVPFRSDSKYGLTGSWTHIYIDASTSRTSTTRPGMCLSNSIQRRRSETPSHLLNHFITFATIHDPLTI
jgi:hypothetical protein